MSEGASELQAILDRWLETYNRHDIEALRQFYCNDIMAIPPDEPIIVGWDLFKLTLQRYLEQGCSHVKHSNAEVKFQGNVGFYCNCYTFYDDTGNTVMSGKGLAVFMKDVKTGEWKIAAKMYTKDQ